MGESKEEPPAQVAGIGDEDGDFEVLYLGEVGQLPPRLRHHPAHRRLPSNPSARVGLGASSQG